MTKIKANKNRITNIVIISMVLVSLIINIYRLGEGKNQEKTKEIDQEKIDMAFSECLDISITGNSDFINDVKVFTNYQKASTKLENAAQLLSQTSYVNNSDEKGYFSELEISAILKSTSHYLDYKISNQEKIENDLVKDINEALKKTADNINNEKKRMEYLRGLDNLIKSNQ